MSSDYRELLLGCGFSREKRMVVPGTAVSGEWQNLHTADINPECAPDYQMDLNRSVWSFAKDGGGAAIWQFPESHFDEIHAYEVLEHLGAQGDVRSFFDTFNNLWRALKPGGHLAATCPSRYSPWLWGDPGHTRAILPCTLTFLDRAQYQHQVGKTPMSDYRHLYRGDFEIVRSNDDRETHRFILKAHKPIRTIFE